MPGGDATGIVVLRAKWLIAAGVNLILLSPVVAGRLRHLDDAGDVGNGLALGDQLLGGLELADDLLRCVRGPFPGGVPGPGSFR